MTAVTTFRHLSLDRLILSGPPHNISLRTSLIICPHTRPGSSIAPLFWGFPTKIYFFFHFSSPIRSIWAAHHVFVHWITWSLTAEDWRQGSPPSTNSSSAGRSPAVLPTQTRLPNILRSIVITLRRFGSAVCSSITFRNARVCCTWWRSSGIPKHVVGK